MVQFLLDNKTPIGELALIVAAREGHLAIVKLLVSKGADVNGQLPWGYTALMLAARDGYLDVVKYLLENGANVSIKNKGGETALMLAMENDQPEIVILLQRAGARAVAAKTKKVEPVVTDDDDEEDIEPTSEGVDDLIQESDEDIPDDIELD